MNYKTYEVRVYINGEKHWYLNDQRHREDGPAVEWADGRKEWWLNGKLHKEDGPAVEWSNGTKKWYLNGQLHREDGPAVEYAEGDKYWCLGDRYLTEVEFNSQTKPQPCSEKIIEMDGKEYKLVEVK